MFGKLFKVYFVLSFLYSGICAQGDIYDNSVLTPTSNQNISSCVFVQTEHFVVDKTDTSARMHLSTNKLFQTILTNLEFISQMEPNEITEINGHWFTEDIFRNVFKYTQLQESDFSQKVNMCTQFLYIRSQNSSVCKLGGKINFNDASCSSLIANLFAFRDWNNNTFVDTLSKLPQNKVYTFVDRGPRVKFLDVNSNIETCKVRIDMDFLSTLQNIYIGTATMFSSFEHLLETYFPQPPCQTLKFNFPQEIVANMPLYKKFPRVLAKFLNANLKVPSTCILFESEATAQPMPVVFTKALGLFNQVFGSVPSFPRNRVKRDTFSRFFEFVFGDASSRLKTLEYANKREVKMTNFLMDKSNVTDLVIQHDERILSNLYKDVKIEHYLVMDLILRLNLERLSNNFHEQFGLSLTRLRGFHTNHQSLLLEFKKAFEHDISQLTSCIRGHFGGPHLNFKRRDVC